MDASKQPDESELIALTERLARGVHGVAKMDHLEQEKEDTLSFQHEMSVWQHRINDRKTPARQLHNSFLDNTYVSQQIVNNQYQVT